MEQRLSLITLGVADVARARDFYEGMGWSGESPDGEVVFFQLRGMILALWGRDKLAEDSVVEDSGGWGGVTLAYNVDSPAKVDAVLADAAEAGATIGRPGAQTFWGGYSGIFIDPDGHPWEVAHNPGWVLDADGSVRFVEPSEGRACGPDRSSGDTVSELAAPSERLLGPGPPACNWLARGAGLDGEGSGGHGATTGRRSRSSPSR